MIERTTNPDKFAAWFNSVVPGAYRKVDARDVRDMTECGLIGRYGYYGRLDLETAGAILQYEQMREKRSAKPLEEDEPKQPSCKMCGGPLPPQLEGREGRRSTA